jgi:hypothetical protein
VSASVLAAVVSLVLSLLELECFFFFFDELDDFFEDDFLRALLLLEELVVSTKSWLLAALTK